MKIVPKFAIGYVLLIVIPFFLFAVVFYRQVHQTLRYQYLVSNERLFEQGRSNLDRALTKVESVYPLLQNDNQLIQYLSHQYLADWEMIYNYNTNISPVFSFIANSNPDIARVTIYMNNDRVLQLPPYMVSVGKYPGPVSPAGLERLRVTRGVWSLGARTTPTGFPALYYDARLYDRSYSRNLGFVQIRTSDQLLSRFAQLLTHGSRSWLLLAAPGSGALYGKLPPGWEASRVRALASGEAGGRSRYLSVSGSPFLVHTAQIPRLELSMVEISRVVPALGANMLKGWVIPGLVLLLLALTLFYFLIASSIARRLVRFSHHLTGINKPAIAPYPGDTGNDEIGLLIGSYNAMLLRMAEAIRAAHRSDLVKKEAQIKMLQAQIKPHFLYNTLETMQMLALLNEEPELAEMAASLGNLLRYSLAKRTNEASLAEEIDTIRSYVQLQKARMGERLRFEIDCPADLEAVTVPRFVLQPVVENSILHGIERRRQGGEIRVAVEGGVNGLLIRVSDDGAGIPPGRLTEIETELATAGLDAEEPAVGIGLRYVSQRLRSYYGEGAGLTLSSRAGGGTTVELRLCRREVRDAQALDR